MLWYFELTQMCLFLFLFIGSRYSFCTKQIFFIFSFLGMFMQIMVLLHSKLFYFGCCDDIRLIVSINYTCNFWHRQTDISCQDYNMQHNGKECVCFPDRIKYLSECIFCSNWQNLIASFKHLHLVLSTACYNETTCVSITLYKIT